MSRTYWQVSAGSHGRDYREDFLKYGMAFVGGETYKERIQKVEPGDVIVLKQGRSKIVAAGEVVERDGVVCGVRTDAHWLKDYDGWDLRGYCHVAWRRAEEPIGVSGLSRGTLQKTSKKAVHEVADAVLQRDVLPVLPEPPPTEEVNDDEMLRFLIRHGMRVGAAEDVTDALRRIRLLAEYYRGHHRWEEIREHETRTFLIVPLMLALGWTEQQIKIELPAKGGRIDMACFEGPYGKKVECRLILEAKGLASGLKYAGSQATAYADAFPACGVIVVSNGFCYKTFEREDGRFADTPSAYLNLLDPRDRYPRDPTVDGALDVLRLLLPR